MYLSFLTTGQKRVQASLGQLVRRLPMPASPLTGKTRPTPPLPENIMCFQRLHSSELNRPRRGRALHHRHVLIVPITGQATVCVDDLELKLKPGNGVVILPYQFHHYVTRPKALHWLFITFEYAPGISLTSLRNKLLTIGGPQQRLLAEFLSVYEQPEAPGAAALLLALLLMQSRLREQRAELQRAADPNAPLVPNVHHFVQTRGSSAPKLRELAHEIGISESHLRTRFRKTCGVSIGKHLRRLRLERAKGLLRMSSARVSEVAEQCGYGSLYSFSRAFQKAYGVAPTEYRNGERRLSADTA